MMAPLRFLVVMLAAMCVFANGEGEKNGDLTEGDEPEFRILGPSPEVEVTCVLPDNEDHVITSGEVVEVVAGFRNTAKNKVFNITGVDASLHWPSDYNYILQNFTGMGLLVQAYPLSEVSFTYTFMADPLLEPTDFGLVVNVYYTDRVNNYTSVVLNTTVDVVEADNTIDSDTLFTYAAAGVVTLVVLLIGYFLTSGSKRTTSRKPVERGTTSSGEPMSEWLEGTHAK